MRFSQRSYEEIVGNVTVQSGEYLDPVMDTLRDWQRETRVFTVKWNGAPLRVDEDDRVGIRDFPLHPYTERRLIRYVLGVTQHRTDFWRSNPDLLVEALRRAPTLREADEVQVRVVNGEVVYVTDLEQNLGSHLDVFEPMADAFVKSLRQTKVPVSMIGYLLDPVWVHLRIAYLSNTAKTHQAGLAFDSNYLFSRTPKGRASLSACAYDIAWESTLTLDNWWNVRTLGLQSNTRDRIVENFTKRLEKATPNIRQEAKNVLSELTRKKSRNARDAWKRDVVTSIGRKFGGQEDARSAMLALDEVGKRSQTDVAFAMAAAIKDLPFDRRVLAERAIANRLKEVS